MHEVRPPHRGQGVRLGLPTIAAAGARHRAACRARAPRTHGIRSPPSSRGRFTRRACASSVHRALQVAPVRIAHVALPAQIRFLAALIFLRRRRCGELHLRMLVQPELVVQDAARHAGRVLRERGRRSRGERARNGGRDGKLGQELHRCRTPVGAWASHERKRQA
ncbi:hypothetical protein BMA0445 [Burkholderia mallei ATCC 23344]|uniref:Uncharacterized protein n=1 Tax=Burkholderia mallei (strain ATCC 23344) TaxID=243160 RepID=A0A0H2WIT9_BURMA|nr:hypothetical protein BMA0445 [Burkholderia mallei ATCC 23344]